MKVYFLTVLSVLFWSIQQAVAQQSIVTIQITEEKTPVPFASVQVTSLTDSSKVWSQTADSLGKATLKLHYGLYTFQASAVSFKPVSRSFNVKIPNLNFSISLASNTNELKEVKILASKPLMRQEDDKTIVDADMLASTSASAYEVIEKTPGLFVDQEGSIYLTSSTPATIFINGREQKMGAADIASMLKSLPPNSIASIEIMRTPSAKYEASTGGGIVNVILKKGFKVGLTGSVNVGMNQGKQGDRWIGFNLSNNPGRVSSFMNMQYTSRNSFQQVESQRFLPRDLSLIQNSYTLRPSDNYQLGYGVNVELKKKWELGYDGRLNYNNNKSTSDNLSQIKDFVKNEISVSNKTDLDNIGSAYNFSQGLNAKYKIDSLGSEWTSDVSFNYLPATSSQNYTFLPAIPQTGGFGDVKTNLSIGSLQSNLLYKFPKRWTMETGLKISNLSFKSNRDFFKSENNTQSNDPIRSGIYDYHENINSAYTQLSKSFGVFILKAGTRLENTNMKGREVFPSDTSFNLHRTDFFPYMYFSGKTGAIFGFPLRTTLIYRRTIARPGYQLLNPAQRFVDLYSYESGNPALKPQFTNTYEINISAMDVPLFQLGINDTKDIFTSVLYSDKNQPTVSYRTTDNLGTNRETYLRLFGGIPPGKKYFFIIGAQYSNNSYTGLYEEQPLAFRRGSWRVFTYHTMKVTPMTGIWLQGFAMFNGQQQFSELSNFGALNFGLNQQLLNKKLTLSLSLNDALRTSNPSYRLEQGSIRTSVSNVFDTRRFGLSLRYNFGLLKKEQQNTDPFNVESPEKENH